MKIFLHNIRISLSLVCLTLTIVFIANGLGLIPDENQSKLRERVNLSEALAVQFSAAIQENNHRIIVATAKSIVERNPQVQSILLRTTAGEIITKYGTHTGSNNVDLTSTPDLIKVPIFKNDKGWGSVEVKFIKLNASQFEAFMNSTILKLSAFFAMFGFIFYFVLIKKLLFHLDPFKVVPVRVKKALDAVSDGIVFIDKDEHIVLANKAFEEKIQINTNSLLGKNISSLPWVNSGKSEEEREIYPWRETIKNNINRIQIPLKIQPYRSEPLTLIVSSTSIQDSGGNVNGALVSFNDVTELEKVSNELESMTKFLRHELNNALVGASGMVSLLEQSKYLSDDDKNIIKRTQRLHQVIKHLLESVKEARSIEASFSNEIPAPLRLDTLLSEMATNYSDIYQDYNFTFDTDNKEIIVLAQEERIIQMLDKLTSNAVEHSIKDSPITISCHREKDNAVIKITNSGSSLPDNKNTIFDLFSSFKSNKDGNNSQGIGLYVVKLIAEAYGGAVEAHNVKNPKGAEFIIKLPITYKKAEG